MPFSFLNPWLLLGALAVAAPVWLHLRRKQETNLFRFSALQFLDDQPEPRASPWRLRDVILFVLRALGLLLLVMAFGWPFLRGPAAAPVKESRMYILDNTLSHQANGGFEQDKQRILSDLDKAGPNIQMGVIELASTPRVVVAFGDDRELAKQKLKAVQPSFQRGSYIAAFRQANTLLANSLGETRKIVFLGDNQENQWNENLNSPPFLGNVQVEMPPTPGTALPNLSLSEPRAQRVFLGDKSLVNFTVKLTHLGEAKTARIVLRGNDQVIFNRELELEKAADTTMLQAQWEADPVLWVRGEVTVEGTPDALAGDNRVFFSLAPVVEGKVAVLAQSHYLKVALSPDIMKGRWATRWIEPTKVGDELAANQDAEVLCIESNYLQSGDARKLLWRYLSNGRGVFLLVNRLTPSINGFLRELGFEAEGMVTAPKGAAEKFQFVFSNHPIFHPFLSPEYGNLLEIKVSRYARLKASGAMPLVFSEKGAALFFQSTRLQGKLFVAAFGLDRDHTSWPIHQSFIPFLDLALQTARAEDPTPTNFEPGEIAVVQMPAGTDVKTVILRDEQRELTRATVEQGRAQVRLPEHPGLYALSYDDETTPQKIFSVNPSPKESQLTYMTAPEAVKVWQMARVGDSERRWAGSARAQLSLAGILQQRVWWWMLVAGLVVLVLEVALAEFRAARH